MDNYLLSIVDRASNSSSINITIALMAEAPIDSHLNWRYTLDKENRTITLKHYLGNEIDISVYGSYEVDGIIYHTKIFNDGNTTTVCLFGFCENIETITFFDNVDTSDLTTMSYMFYRCTSLKNIEFGKNFSTTNVNSMNSVFGNCSSLKSLDLTSFNTNNIRTSVNSHGYMYMFVNCSSLQSINVTKNKWKESIGEGMFQGCATSSVTYV